MKNQQLKGVGAAAGLAIGQAVRWRKEQPTVTMKTVADTDAEQQRLEKAVEEARRQLQELRQTTRERMSEEEAGIFDAHLSFLDDPAFIGEMKNRIHGQSRNAEAVCQQVTNEMSDMLAALDDEYMQARADDIRDVGRRLLLLLAGIQPFDPQQLKPGSVIIADELAPSDTAQFPPGIAAMVTARGSKTSHAAIMARTLGIPAVLGLGESLERIEEGSTLIVDGESGDITLSPDEETRQRAQGAIKRQQEIRTQARKRTHQDAVTTDGQRIQVFANIGSPADVDAALQNGAEGIGLFRTEFLYLENDHWPTEAEQVRAYRQVLEAFGEKPVIIRTLDIGGDKALPYAKMPQEENPFLGQRAIRFCLANPDIFKTQLRALLRAGLYGNLWIMFPMVGNLSELREAKALLEECREELASEGIRTAASVKVGIMVEVPAAAVHADILAREVDFMSIGTNDLTQYTLAADRDNERVSPLYDAAHPAVLRLIRHTCDAAHHAGILVGICGELAGDTTMTATLVGLGLEELSMSAGAIPEVKESVRKIDTKQARKWADTILQAEDADHVRSIAKENLH
jgi:phosphotransferase system enzyme I (PtsI)